jgi:hypothetical protein
MKAVPQISLLVLGLLPLPPAVGETLMSGAVRDRADLFHHDTRAKAEEQIHDIRRQFHRDVLVETIPSLPAADRARFKSMRRLDQLNYFIALGQQRAREAEVDGVHILFCRDPRQVQVTVWPEFQQQTFTDEDAERLRRLLKHRRYSSGVDQALLDGINMIRETYQRNLHFDPDNGLARPSTMALSLIAFLGVWLALLLASTRLRAQSADKSPLHPGLLGTLFGHVASLWIYDLLFANEPAHRGEVMPAAPLATDLVPPARTFGSLSDSRVGSSSHHASLPSG